MIDDIVKRAIDYPTAPRQSILHEGRRFPLKPGSRGGSGRRRHRSSPRDRTGLRATRAIRRNRTGDIRSASPNLRAIAFTGAYRRLRRHARHTTRMPGRQGSHRRDLVGRRTIEPHARNGVAWTRLRFRDIHAGKFNHPSRSKNRQGPSLPEFTRPLRSGGSADSPGGRSGGRTGLARLDAMAGVKPCSPPPETANGHGNVYPRAGPRRYLPVRRNGGTFKDKPTNVL